MTGVKRHSGTEMDRGGLDLICHLRHWRFHQGQGPPPSPTEKGCPSPPSRGFGVEVAQQWRREAERGRLGQGQHGYGRYEKLSEAAGTGRRATSSREGAPPLLSWKSSKSSLSSRMGGDRTAFAFSCSANSEALASVVSKSAAEQRGRVFLRAEAMVVFQCHRLQGLVGMKGRAAGEGGGEAAEVASEAEGPREGVCMPMRLKGGSARRGRGKTSKAPNT